LHACGCIDLVNGKQQSEKADRVLVRLLAVRESGSFEGVIEVAESLLLLAISGCVIS
jgi:hypothetical protein